MIREAKCGRCVCSAAITKRAEVLLREKEREEREEREGRVASAIMPAFGYTSTNRVDTRPPVDLRGLVDLLSGG